MIEVDETLTLLSALDEGAPVARLEELLRGPELQRMFPAIGLPSDLGLEFLRAVLDPARLEGLDETGREIVAYFRELTRARAEIEAFLRIFRPAEPSVTAAAFAATREFLPDSCDLGEIRFVFLPIGLDFRTDQQTVYVDPLAALQYGLDGVRRTLSHEFHHVARYRWTGVNLTLMRPEEERLPESVPEVLRDWARWLEAEGIADCVSKATDVEIPALAEALDKRRRQMAGYGEMLEGALARLHEMMAPGTPEEPAISSLHHDLRNMAHPVGYRMAELILAESGRRALAECVGNPSLFVRRYNALAQAKGLVGFDEELLQSLGASSAR